MTGATAPGRVRLPPRFPAVPTLRRLAGGLLLLASTAWVGAGTIYVKAGAAGKNNGNSWTNAYRSLQKALKMAVNGDEIWVAAGTYKPTGRTDRGISFRLADGVGIYGGFAGNETDRDQRDWATNKCTLSGDIGRGGKTGDNSYHVVRSARNNATAVLDGFTVTRGNANYGRSASSWGGGLYCTGGSPTVRNCTFTKNSASWGGGILTNNSSPAIRDCKFTNNRGRLSGAGVFCYKGTPTIKNCSFSQNKADWGGGIYAQASSPNILNCSFSQNTATNYAGGIFCNAAAPSIENTIMWGNAAGKAGNEIYNYDGSSPNFRYCNVTGWSASLGADRGGNSGSNPLFTNAANNNLTLSSGSPCIDSADGDLAPTSDLRGGGRFDAANSNTGTGSPSYADRGAFEYGPPPPPMGVDASRGSNPGEAVLSWNAATGATGYRIYYDEDSTAPPFVPSNDGSPASGTAVGNVTTVTISGLTPGQRYYFAVAPYNAVGGGSYSPQDRATVMPNPPPAPTGINAQAGSSNGEAVLSWNAAATATSYRVYYDEDSTGPPFAPSNNGNPTNGKNVGNVTTVTITGLTPNQVYYFAVRAVNVAGTSGYSTQDTATVKYLPVPAAPTSVRASPASAYGKIILRWGKVAGATGYRIFYDDENNPPIDAPVKNGKPASGANVKNVRQVTIRGLKPGKRYYLKVAAYNGDGLGNRSKTVAARAGNIAKGWITGYSKVKPNHIYSKAARYILRMKWTTGKEATVSYGVKWRLDSRGRALARIAEKTGALTVNGSATPGRWFTVFATYRGRTYKKSVQVVASSARAASVAANSPVLLYRLSSRPTRSRRGGRLFVDPAGQQFTAVVTWRDSDRNRFYQRQDWHDEDLADYTVDGPDDSTVQLVAALSPPGSALTLRQMRGRLRELILGDATLDAARRYRGVETTLDPYGETYAAGPLLARLDGRSTRSLAEAETDFETAIANFIADLEGRGFVAAPVASPRRHAAPPAADGVLVYRQRRRLAVVGDGEKVVSHRGGFLVVDLANDLATALSTRIDADENRFYSRQDWHLDADLLLDYQVTGRKRALQVLATLSSAADADGLTNFDLVDLKGALRRNGGPARLLQGRLQVGSAGDAYFGNGTLNARLDLRRTQAVTGDHAEAVAALIAQLEQRGHTAE